jgi:5,10-methenyltetrahydrofolate synthetase
MASSFDTGGDPPCLMPDLVDGHVVDPQTRKDVAAFRRKERQRLYACRKELPSETRTSMSAVIAGKLDELIGDKANQIIAAYWPIRGEVDLRAWMALAHRGGARICLPVIVRQDHPVEFHVWQPRCRMKRGFWNILVPEDGEAVIPDTVVVPLLGVDNLGYRLGNGGGYYDRTLARMPAGTRIIGVGQPFAGMETIFPMPWDIPMHIVILGDGSVRHLT